MRTRVLFQISAALLCVFLQSPALAQGFQHSYAVVIGIDDYQKKDPFPHLDYPVTDARAIAEILKQQGFTVQPFYGPSAKKDAILGYLRGTLAKELVEEDRVLFFFAGHGHREEIGGVPRGFIVPYDASDTDSMISMEDIKTAVDYMDTAKHILLLLDSCYGGTLLTRADHLLRNDFDADLPANLRSISEQKARQAFTSGGPQQEVFDSDGRNGHSPFVSGVLKALSGEADHNHDGYITFSELVQFVQDYVGSDQQTPVGGTLPKHEGGEFWFKSPLGKLAAEPTATYVGEGAPRRAATKATAVKGETSSTSSKTESKADVLPKNIESDIQHIATLVGSGHIEDLTGEPLGTKLRIQGEDRFVHFTSNFLVSGADNCSVLTNPSSTVRVSCEFKAVPFADLVATSRKALSALKWGDITKRGEQQEVRGTSPSLGVYITDTGGGNFTLMWFYPTQ